MNIIIQARTGSQRFPNKVLHEIDNISIIERVYTTCSEILNTIVAIPSNDAKLATFLTEKHIPFYLGSELDVLSRIYNCAKAFRMQSIMRVTGDCPLLSPAELVYHTWLFNQQKVDFVSNCFKPRSSPDGWDCEIMTFQLLEKVNSIAEDPLDREHVTSYIYRNKDQLGIKYIGTGLPINLKKIKCSIDVPKDIEKLKKKGYI